MEKSILFFVCFLDKTVKTESSVFTCLIISDNDRVSFGGFGECGVGAVTSVSCH